MNLHRSIEPDKWADTERLPTLEQRLRFIDLTFESVTKARQEYEADNGRLYPNPFPDEGPSEGSKAIGRLASELRLMAMQAEGLPLTLLAKCDREKLSADNAVRDLIDPIVKGHRAFKRSMK